MSKHLSMGPSLMPDLSCISLTVMLQRLKDFATNMNVPLTGTTPMSTTAACIMPIFTLVHLGLWYVSRHVVLLTIEPTVKYKQFTAEKGSYKQCGS